MYDRLHHWFFAVLQYSKTLGSSFHSSLLYVDVVKRWNGLGIGYLLFLIILGSLPLSYRLNIAFDHFFKQKILLPIESIPSIPIHDGIVVYNKPIPYLIKNNNGEIVLIIDTTGTVSEMNEKYPELIMLITKNKIDFRPPSYKQFLNLSKDSINNPIYTRTFDKKFNGFISGEAWLRSSGILKIKTIMKIFIFPLVTLFYFVIFGVTLLLLSSIVQLYSDIFFNRKIPFKASCRLLSVAATPALLLFFLMQCSGFALPNIDYVVIVLTYISYALYSVKRLCV